MLNFSGVSVIIVYVDCDNGGRHLMDLSRIDYLGLDRVIKRGSAEIIEKRHDALFIRDVVSGAYMLACRDRAAGASLLERHAGRGYELLMVSDYALGIEAYERYGFSEKLECYQAAYYGEKPKPDATLSVRCADEGDLSTLTENYDLISAEELKEVVGRGSILLGYHEGELVGFIGEHLEGSMGILYVFPEYRKRGFATELQKHMIAKTMEAGHVPFGQVEKDNESSLNLQKKLGMTLSDELIVWMWK